MNRHTCTAAVIALLLAAPAHAIESPLTYARSSVKLTLQHPKDAKHPTLSLDAEIRSEESTVHTPGWYNFSTMADDKAAMMLYAAPAVATIESSNDYAPADILFVDAYGTIRQILPSLVPAQLQETVASSEPVLAVIYMKGGSAERLGIEPGDQVEYGIFRKKPVMITEPPKEPPLPPAVTSASAPAGVQPEQQAPDQIMPSATDQAPAAEQPAAPAATPPAAAPAPQTAQPAATPPKPSAPAAAAAPAAGQPVVAPPNPNADAEREKLIDKILKQNDAQ